MMGIDRFFTISGIILIATLESSAFFPLTCFQSRSTRQHSPLLSLSARIRPDNCNDDVTSSTSLRPVSEYFQPTSVSSRREFFLASLLTGASLTLSPSPSFAADNPSNGGEGVVSTGKLASLLATIPTFAIVDPRGVPYFVVGEDAKLTSYFFLSYGEAKRILNVAESSADKAIKEARAELKKKNNGVLTKDNEEEIGTNPWKSARITSVPLDLAVSLASKGKLAGAYFRLAPSETDIEDALSIDGSDDLPEGKVPLFYMENMTISEGSGSELRSPLYFQKDQLIAEWKQQQQQKQKSSNKENSAVPDVKVTELFATLKEMIRPGGTDEELKSLLFVAPKDSKMKAKQLLAGEKEPFRLGERNIVL
ncbi:hypothetical protein HJC23_002567 [Cyclotella cryptica]|uniref:Tic22-like protein n=1 Tax=Cyclotella cryptica TaxID=29204 RepID=A0ABD3PKR8_9STRA